MNASPSKNILRTGFIKFFTIFAVLLVSYTYLSLDKHLAYSLKKGLEGVHGAQVDVVDLKTDLIRAKVSIENIQFTNKKDPGQNIAEVKKINVQFLTDALLRARIVIEDISLADVQVDTKRESPGVVFPVTQSEILNNLSRAREKRINTVKEENNQNSLGLVINLLEGKSFKNSSAGIADNIKSDKLIQQLESQLTFSEQQWEKDKVEIEKRILKYNNFKLDKNPKKALTQIKQINKDYKALKSDYISYQSKVKKFKHDISKTKKAIRQDFKTLKTSSALPGINIQEQLNKVLREYLMIQFSGLIKTAREIENKIPKGVRIKIEDKVLSNKVKKQDLLKDTRRKFNIVYAFPTEKSYPLFWLKKFELNISKENKYIINGKVEHISSNSSLINKLPYGNINIEGDAIPVKSIKAEMSMDEKMQIQFSGSLGPYTRSDLTLIDSPDFSWQLQAPRSVSNFKGTYQAKLINIKINQVYEQFSPKIKMKKGRAKEIMKKVIREISPITISTNIYNTLQSPRFKVKSNVGGLFETNLKNEVSAELNKAMAKNKKKLQDKVDQKVNGIEEKYNSVQKKLLSKLKIKRFDMKKQKEALFKKTLNKIDPKKINFKKLKLDKIF